MPYYFDTHDPPKQDAFDWEEMGEMWNTIKNDLLDFYFEAEEEGLARKNRPDHDETEYRYIDWRLVRFRRSDDEEMLWGFHDMGLEALAYVEHSIKNKQFNATLLYYWGRLTACHSYVLCAAMAKSTDLGHLRAGNAGKAVTSIKQQQIWFSHYYLRERPKFKNREETEEQIEALIHAITDGEIPEVSLEHQKWCEKLLSLDKNIKLKDGKKKENPRYNKLTKSFRNKQLSEKMMKNLVEEILEKAPPIDLKIPPSK